MDLTIILHQKWKENQFESENCTNCQVNVLQIASCNSNLVVMTFVKFRGKWRGAGVMKNVFKLQHLLNMELVFVFYVIKLCKYRNKNLTKQTNKHYLCAKNSTCLPRYTCPFWSIQPEICPRFCMLEEIKNQYWHFILEPILILDNLICF